MKIIWNKRYNTIALYSCVVACLIVLICFLFVNFGYLKDILKSLTDLLDPIITGLIIAYLFNPLFIFYEKKVFDFVGRKKPALKLKRVLSLTSVYLTFTVILTLFILFIVPQVISSYSELQEKAAGYISSVMNWIDEKIGTSGTLHDQYEKLLSYADIDALKENINRFLSSSLNAILSGTSLFFAFVGNVFTQIRNIFFGIVLSFYFLYNKENLKAKIKKLMKAAFNDKISKRITGIVHKTDETFGGYIIGKIIDSIIVAVIIFIILAIVDMPYYPLITVIVGVTNIIPYFGPFIGGIPSVFIVFVADPVMAFWLALIILIVQQIDGNFIDPKITSSKIGLRALWGIMAITVMGGLFGITGMFIGAPVFAVIYSLVKEVLEKRLSEKNLPVETDCYMNETQTGGK